MGFVTITPSTGEGKTTVRATVEQNWNPLASIEETHQVVEGVSPKLSPSPNQLLNM